MCYPCYLYEPEIVEHLVVDFLDEIPGEVHGADFGDAAESAPSHVRYQIIG